MDNTQTNKTRLKEMAQVDLMPLSSWLNKQPDSVVAVRLGSTSSKKDFQVQVQLWMDAIRDFKGLRWAIYYDDAFEFLAIIFALWQLERTACILGDNRPGTVKRLADYVDGFIGEFPDGVPDNFLGKVVTVDDKNCECNSTCLWFDLKPEFTALEIYTSGSTGKPKLITKTISQLERELEVLESLWPSESNSVVLATVSHQHLYGMTFRLFWPLSSGRPFERKLCEYPEDILRQARCYPLFSLISSPSHLGRMNNSLCWDEVANSCQYVISSAASLEKEDSLNVHQLLQAPIREIYGSSETGAIAWRIQQKNEEEALWQALPDVKVNKAVGGNLNVESPYLGTADSFTVSDRVEFDHKGKFKLLGRADRIVKVEGKRVSLEAIEQLLLQGNVLVKHVKALTLHRRKVEIGVVLQLTKEGVEQLSQHGRKSLIKSFREILADYVEAVILPRRWRFVDQLPYNQQGKLPLRSLQVLFDKKAITWPQIIYQELNDGILKITCHIPSKLVYFQGHFKALAVLPGIVQVHWAESFGRQFLSVTGDFVRLEAIKFKQIISPDYYVTITLNYDSENMKLSFEYGSEKGVYSSGRICFA